MIALLAGVVDGMHGAKTPVAALQGGGSFPPETIQLPVFGSSMAAVVPFSRWGDDSPSQRNPPFKVKRGVTFQES